MFDATKRTNRTYVFYTGVVLAKFSITVSVFEVNDLIYYSLIAAALVLSLLLSTYCVFQTSHQVIRPLRILNTRMNEILQEDNYDSLDLDGLGGKCKEISDL